MARVCLHGPLRKLAGDQSELELSGATVAELLGQLERAYPDIGGWIVDERGLVRRHISVFVNGRRGGAETELAADDRVELVTAITGGAPGITGGAPGITGGAPGITGGAPFPEREQPTVQALSPSVKRMGAT